MRRYVRVWPALLVLALTLAAAHPIRARQIASRPGGNGKGIRFVPDDLGNPQWLQVLQQLRADQIKALEAVPAFHDFQFTDRLSASGITFKHSIVDDAGRAYKAAHYDHGNGIAVADVDGDGLLDVYFLSQTGGNQLWRNLGSGRFEDITASAGVGVQGRISASAS